MALILTEALSLRRRRGLRSPLNPERLHDSKRRLERGIAILAERTIELLPGQACLGGDLCHAFGASDNAQCVRNKGGILGLERLRHKQRNAFVRDQVFGRIIRCELFGHIIRSILSQVALPS